MKLPIIAAIVATLATPLAAFAQQSDGGMTRAEVRAQLVELEQAGWRPQDDGPTYPARLEAAEARIAANHRAAAQTAAANNQAAAGTNRGS
jgi:hypothetical protein